ncbi:CynX/NimT family MFS transporter [Sinomonas atrocyanea]|uniref:MFS transporter n=1 Tax=Sinomonas atrocyanea TaxID=37927 RepID=UPI00277E4879|nr:MFS transporter [Sinomonas atrocyanea]MDQ0261520.1 CP family cyanate transporter-like MFS transporter [Sinomonas atrocyanea]MDR6623220.1 CP family cyanate transporter-like MFS transporter [Sinomonas atrocyanea]
MSPRPQPPAHSSPRQTGHPRAAAAWLLLVSIGLIALTMRGPFVAVAPVARALEGDLGLSAGELGLLTGIPVLCFALAAPLASLCARRFGAEMAVTLTLAGVLAGVLIRSLDGTAVVMLGTVVLGVAITVGNIAVPLIIRRDFTQARQGMAMGVYTAALNVGSFVTSVATAPLAAATGWRVALAASALFALVALMVWVAAVGVRRALRPEGAATASDHAAPRARRTGAVTVALAFGFGGQAFSYYGITAWLPSLLTDELGLSAAGAGAGASLFQIMAILGALGTPLLARYAGSRATVAALGILWLTVPLGLLLQPGLWALWSSLGGAAQGGGITFIFTAILTVARDQAAAGRMSAIVQGTGYGVAAIAPTLLGGIHSAAASWTPPLVAVLVAVIAFFAGTGAAVLLAARRR